MPTIRDWLQLFRSHTSPLEMTIAGAGAALASGSLWDINVLLFVIFGWIYHNAGYGQNSVEDFIRGYDREDPNKAHHPLQRGAIPMGLGRKVTTAGVALVLLYGGIICGFDPLSSALLVSLVTMGLVYNFFNKLMPAKFLPIAIAHSLIFPFSFFGAGGFSTFSPDFPFVEDAILAAALASTLYLILQIAYQIMIEGDLKDIDMEEASFLKKLGAWVEGGEFGSSGIARSVSAGLKIASAFTLIWIAYLLGARLPSYTLLIGAGLLLLLLDQRLMGRRTWDHSRTLKDMAIMEVFSTFALVMALIPTIGWIPAILFMGLQVIYFVLMNRFLWGTVIKPKV